MKEYEKSIGSAEIVICFDDMNSYSPAILNNEKTFELIQTESCKAPIASLDCMEDFATSTDGPNSNHAPISRQTSLNVNLGIHYKNLGKSGLRVSNLALATWITFGAQVTDEVAEDIVALAYDSGINVFDTAEAFTAGRAELLLGKILKKKGWRRSSYVVMTKLYWGGNKAETERGLSRKHIIESIQSSLERLQLSYVDVVFANKVDPHCPMEEIVRAFTFCINQGMAMYWGTSRWSAIEIMEAYAVARQFNLIPPICEQMEYHMFCREKAELHLPEMYHKIGVGAMAWSPLVCGVLNNKFDEGVLPISRSSIKGYTWLKDKLQTEDIKKQQAKIQEVSVIAEKLGCTFSQLTVAWCLRNDNVHCVLVGATTVEQIYEHIQALQMRPKLNTAMMAQLDTILDNKPIRPPLKR